MLTTFSVTKGALLCVFELSFCSWLFRPLVQIFATFSKLCLSFKNENCVSEFFTVGLEPMYRSIIIGHWLVWGICIVVNALNSVAISPSIVCHVFFEFVWQGKSIRWRLEWGTSMPRSTDKAWFMIHKYKYGNSVWTMLSFSCWREGCLPWIDGCVFLWPEAETRPLFPDVWCPQLLVRRCSISWGDLLHSSSLRTWPCMAKEQCLSTNVSFLLLSGGQEMFKQRKSIYNMDFGCRNNVSFWLRTWCAAMVLDTRKKVDLHRKVTLSVKNT